jgi:hypothetical protein
MENAVVCLKQIITFPPSFLAFSFAANDPKSRHLGNLQVEECSDIVICPV